MERMIESRDIKHMACVERIKQLEEENKKLKEDVERLIKLSEHKTTTIMGLGKNLDEVKEENKKLNIKVASLEGEIKGLNSVIDKLKEENQTLELWLDRKEKLNEKYRKEIEELKETLEHRDSVLSIMYDLLRSDLGDYEQLCMIDVVIDVEVGNEPQNKLREELLDRFWKRDF